MPRQGEHDPIPFTPGRQVPLESHPRELKAELLGLQPLTVKQTPTLSSLLPDDQTIDVVLTEAKPVEADRTHGHDGFACKSASAATAQTAGTRLASCLTPDAQATGSTQVAATTKFIEVLHRSMAPRTPDGRPLHGEVQATATIIAQPLDVGIEYMLETITLDCASEIVSHGIHLCPGSIWPRSSPGSPAPDPWAGRSK